MARVSKTEQLYRDLMAHYHPELQPRFGYRPNWLKNPETGRNLEIDAFYPDLQAGVELNGVQHGRPTIGLQKNFAAFEKQQRHDRYKAEMCAEWGVKLYSLTIFDLTAERFPAFLRRFEQDNRLLPNRYADYPLRLFQEAEDLSRAKVVKRLTYQPPAPDRLRSRLQRIVEWFFD